MTNEQCEEYSRLIYSIASYFNGYKSKEDLYQAGYIGLIEAYNNYNPSFGAKFSTYAYTYILGQMKKLVREDKGIKISRNLSMLNLKIEKARILMSQKLMREPTLEEISLYLEIPLEVVIEASKTIGIVQSLDEVVNSDTKDLTLYDVVKSEELDLDTLVAFKEELNNLTSFEKQLVKKKYLEDLTQDEVSKQLGITQVQVSRKLNKIKEKMRYNIAS